MSNVLPPSLGLAAAAARGAPAGVQGTITNPPLAIAQLATGTILRGQVLRQDARGHILVRTDLGTLQILSAAQIAAGSQVTLQLRTAGSQLHVTILQVEGQPAQSQRPTPLPAVPQPGTGPPAAPAQTPAAPPDVLVIGQSLEAVLQVAPKAGKTSPAQAPAPPPLPPGSRLQLHVLRVEVPSATPPGQAPSAPQLPDTPPGNVRMAPGAQLPGFVAGSTASGQPLVQTAVGLLKLGLPTTLPKGTQVVFELEAVTPAARAAQTELAPPRPAALIYSWPALDEALTLLQQLDGAAGQALLAGSNVPRPGPRLASTILFFLQALGRGDLNGWLGQQAAEALGRAGRSDLLSRMGQDLAQLGRLSDNAGSEWRFLPFPLFDGGPVQPLRLFVRSRRDRGGGGAEGDEEPTRFILEVEISHFGDLQLDGLVRDRRFDLVLRTRKPLSEVMRRDIAVIFGHANELSGTQGQIAFQAASDWSFMALKQPAADAAGLVV